MKYYIDNNGKYLGGSDNTPLSAIEVTTPPNDAREIWDGTQWNKPTPTKQEIIKSISDALQNVLDTEAQKLGYDNIVTVVSYADESAIPSFQIDGQSFRAWRSNVWKYFIEVSSIEDIQPDIEMHIASMPKRLQN